MKTSMFSPLWLALLASTINPAQAYGYEHWTPPGPGDIRSPCPMLNALANHHIIPHNGRNMTNATLFPAFTQTLNLGPEVASNLFRQGVLTTNNPNGTSFDFTDINRHGPIEDDSSLSRKDVYFGDAVAFDNYTWAQTKSYFTEEIIDIQHASDARVSRLFWSNWTNPEYNWTKSAAPAATFGAVTLFMSVLGDNEAGTVRKDFVNELFAKERLPTNLGWKRPENIITGLKFGTLQAKLAGVRKNIFPLPDNFQQANV